MNRLRQITITIAASPSVWIVAGALCLVGLAIVGTLLAGLAYTTRASSIVVARNEPVLIAAPRGSERYRATARIDTGADRSSVDREIIDALGIDLAGAREVTVSSSLGRERRPLVTLTVEVAGSLRTLEVSVTDRSGRSTEVLLGVDALDGLVIDPDRASGGIGTSAGDRMVWGPIDEIGAGDLPRALLLLLPLAAAIVVGLRMVVGLQPLGTFAPVLLGLALVYAGPVYLFLASAAMAATFAVQPVFLRLRVPRQARLAALIGLVVIVWMLALRYSPNGLGFAHGVPVIVTVVVIDRLWSVVTETGAMAGLRSALHTVLATVAVLLVLGAQVVHVLALHYPYLFVGSAIVLAVAAGSYRGLRVTELRRFRPHAITGVPTPLYIDLVGPVADPHASEEQLTGAG